MAGAIRKAGSAVAIAVVGGLLAASPPGSGAVPTEASHSSRGSSGLADAILASGRVLIHGAAARGATVVAFAWPDQRRLRQLRPGARLRLMPVGWSRTGADGTFEIAATAGGVPRGLQDPHGNVNIELVAVAGGRQIAYNYGAHLASPTRPMTARWVRPSPGTTPERVPAVAFDLASGSVRSIAADAAGRVLPALGHSAERRILASDQAQPESPALARSIASLTARSPARSAASAGGSVKAAPCYVTGTNDYRYGRPEHFTTTETVRGIPETVTEGSSSTHTLGVAVSVAHGGWSQDGTASLTDDSDVSVSTTYTTSRQVFNRVNSRKYLNGCLLRFEWREIGFYDMLTGKGVPVNETGWIHCGYHRPTSIWHTSHATNYTFGAGLRLGFINVSAQAGYGKSVQLLYHFNVRGEVCGNDHRGPSQSSLLEADRYVARVDSAR